MPASSATVKPQSRTAGELVKKRYNPCRSRDKDCNKFSISDAPALASGLRLRLAGRSGRYGCRGGGEAFAGDLRIGQRLGVAVGFLVEDAGGIGEGTEHNSSGGRVTRGRRSGNHPVRRPDEARHGAGPEPLEIRQVIDLAGGLRRSAGAVADGHLDIAWAADAGVHEADPVKDRRHEFDFHVEPAVDEFLAGVVMAEVPIEADLRKPLDELHRAPDVLGDRRAVGFDEDRQRMFFRRRENRLDQAVDRVVVLDPPPRVNC